MNENHQEEQNREEGGVSIRDIFRIIGKKIWWVLLGSVAVAVAAALIFMFSINPNRKTSSKSFQINFPFSKLEKYSDGSAFNYRDIVSKENISNVIASNENFKSLNADTLVKNNAVSVSAEKINEEKNERPQYIYTVTLKNAYFKGVDADEFIQAMSGVYASFIAEKALNMIYSINPDTFGEASYKDQLLILDQQKEILLSQYNSWVNEYNAGYVIGKKSLGNYRTETMITFADNVRTPIENELKFSGFEYFNAQATGEEVKSYVEQLERQIELNSVIIKNLLEALQKTEGGSASSEQTRQTEGGSASSEPTLQARSAMPRASSTASDENSDNSSSSVIIMPGDSDLSQRLAYYIEQNAILEQQTKYLRNGKGADAVTDEDYGTIAAEIKEYGKKLIVQRDELNSRGDDLKTAISKIYLQDTFFVFTSQSVSSQGGTSTILVAGAGFVVACVVLLVVAYCLGVREEKKKATKSSASEDKAQSGTSRDGE